MDNWIIIAELLGKWINVNFCNRLALIDFDVSLSYPPYSSLPHHPIYQHKQYDGIKVISILYLYLYILRYLIMLKTTKIYISNAIIIFKPIRHGGHLNWLVFGGLLKANCLGFNGRIRKIEKEYAKPSYT